MSQSRSTGASLRFWGAELVPEEVSQTLKSGPDRSHAKGDTLFANAKGLERIADTGLWQLSATDNLSWDLDSQIDELLGRFTLDMAVWSNLTASFQADMYCGVFCEKWNGQLGLRPATLKLLSDRGLKLTLDIYQPSADRPSPDKGK